MASQNRRVEGPLEAGELEHQIQDLQAKQKAARRKLEQLERTGDSTLKRARRPAKSALYGVHHAIRRIVSGFK